MCENKTWTLRVPHKEKSDWSWLDDWAIKSAIKFLHAKCATTKAAKEKRPFNIILSAHMPDFRKKEEKAKVTKAL